MDEYERERLGNFILKELHKYYDPVGKLPTMKEKNSPECLKLRERIEEAKDEKSMQELIDRIMQKYKEKEKLPYPALFPPSLIKKKEKKAIEVTV